MSEDKYARVGICFPSGMVQQIDFMRGGISRSKYTVRLLEKVLQTGQTLGGVDQLAGDHPSNESDILDG